MCVLYLFLLFTYRNSPSQAQTIIGGGSSSQFIYENETILCGSPTNMTLQEKKTYVHN